MLQAIRRSKTLIHSIRAITQATNASAFVSAPSFNTLWHRSFSTTPSAPFAQGQTPKTQRSAATVKNQFRGKQSDLSNPALWGKGTLKQRLEQPTTPSYDPMSSRIKLLAAGLYHDSPNQSREYLKSAVYPDLDHLRACAYVEMENGNYNEARIILKELYQTHPDNVEVVSDLCRLEDYAGNMSAFAKYCRVLRRVKNRNAALRAELRRIADLSSSSEPSQQPTLHSRMDRSATRALDDPVAADADAGESVTAPVNFDELLYLDPRDERAAMRQAYAEAVEHAPRKKDVVINWAHREADGGCIDKAIAILENAVAASEGKNAGLYQLELAKYFYFLNDIARSTAAIKQALQDPAVKPEAVLRYAELNELCEGVESALQFLQYAVDQPGSDAQTWKFYLDFVRDHKQFDLYLKVAQEAAAKFPEARFIGAHLVNALLRNKDYKNAFSAIAAQIERNPTSVFTYEYLLSACEGHADPRVLNYIYHEGVTHIRDNAFLFQQYGEFLEELNEYENAREMFKQAYAITPTDDLARSIVRMCVELEQFEEANGLLDALIDEYQHEVEFEDSHMRFAEAERRAEDGDDEEADEDDAFFEDNSGTVPDEAVKEPFETAYHMMPRLLADKAMIAARMKHFEYAQQLFENALELDAADPYVLLTAVEELYEPTQQFDRILEVFRMLPIIDPNREFALEARSLRQNILETILESEATNKQIYDLYHVQDDSNRDYYARYEDGWNDETTDYFGRSVHTHASVNDGFDTFGYDHRRHVEADDAALKPFLIGEMPAETMEGVRAVDFYKYMPAALAENYNNYAWYEIPLMKEWLVKKDEEPKGVPAVDWNGMRDATGALKVPASAVFDEKHNLKVSLSDLGALREALAGEYEMMPRELKEGLEDREGMAEMKTQDQLVKEIRKNWGDAYSEWNDVSTEIHFPSDKEDFATSYLMNDALVRFSNGEEGEEEEGEEEPRKKAW